MSDRAIDVSVVVPMFNEAECVTELHRRLSEVLTTEQRTYELIFVDDGSIDATFDTLQAIQQSDPHVIVVKLRANFGQTGAIAAGVELAAGRIIVLMDGDLQNLPEEMPLMLHKIDEGFDIVSGWRRDRQDSFLLRRLPSRIANKLMAWLSDIPLHDFGTTFKAYRADVIKPLPLYGQFHRFIPVLAQQRFKPKICEVLISYPERKHGKSHYSLARTVQVFFDVIRLRFLTTYLTRPLQGFGSLGLIFIFSGASVWIFLFVSKYYFGYGIKFWGLPVFLTSVFLIMFGVQFFTFGLLGEVIIKLHYDTHQKKDFVIDRLCRAEPTPDDEGPC